MKFINQLQNLFRKKCVWLSLVLIIVLFGDSMLGHSYHKFLCSATAGTYTHHQIKMGPSGWGGDGYPKFYDMKYGLDISYFKKGRFLFEVSSSSRPLNVTTVSQKMIDTETGDILFDRIGHTFTGGWLVNHAQPFQVTSKNCDLEIKDYFGTDPVKGYSNTYGDRARLVFIK